MKRRCYESYRDSGVEWLNEVPAHWVVDRLKWSVLEAKNGVWGNEPDGVDDLVCIRVADFNRHSLRVDLSNPTLRAIPHAQRRGRLLARGDLLLEKSGGGEHQLVGCVVSYECDEAAVTSNFVARLRAVPKSAARFWAYVHAALYSGRLNYPAIKQTTGIQNLDASAYFDTPAPFPPHDEQRAIAAFLDRETSRVDALIEKKQLLIERLEEQRTALISRTVTRGLPPEAARAADFDLSPRLKPSGVEWLGDVPEHWEVTRVAATARGGKESFTDGDWVELPHIIEEGVRLIQTGNVGIGAYREQGFRYISDESFDELRCTEVDAGDVLICRLADPVGRACLAPNLGDRMITSVDVCILKPSGAYSADYLVYLFSSKPYLEYVESTVRGGTRDRISRSMLGAIKIGIPPRGEQDAIVAFLNDTLGRLDQTTLVTASAIERLYEYRTALITAAVTGKIDVRESAREEIAAG